MLFILTGDIQTGKTRWLEKLIDELAREGIGVQGVLAPGVWRSGDAPEAIREYVDENGFEKLGIDNVLLPEGERVPFARRRDVAIAEGMFDPNAQSSKANMLWYIDEHAIERVNAHLASLPHQTTAQSNLLVIDELGRLELEHDGGLTEAIRLVEAGPSTQLPHALVVVRKALLPLVENRFLLWGDAVAITPDDASMHMIVSAFAKH